MPIVSRYEIDRGRQNEMDTTGTGTAKITMIDTTGELDPAGGGGSYNPLTPAAIGLDGSPIFTGFVARWGYRVHQTEEYAVATIDCVDGMEVIAACEMKLGLFGADVSNGAIRFASQSVQDRINHLLDKVGWGTNREIFSGNVRLQRNTNAARTSALAAIQEAAEAEFPGVANFFMRKDGWPVFHGRLARFNPEEPSYNIAVWPAGDEAAVAGDGSRAVIFDLDYDVDKERLVNSALATPENIHPDDIAAQYVEDATSIGQRGTRSWSAENLILEHGNLTGNTALDECREVFATYYVDNYAQPRTRINRISFRSLPPDHPYAASVLALLKGVDVSDIIRLTTGTVGGGFAAEDFFVEGLHYVVEPAGDDWLDVRLDLDVSPRAYWETLPG